MAKKRKVKDMQPESKQEEIKEKIKAIFAQESIYSEDKSAKEVYEQSRFGEIKGNKITYSLVEALYLLEKNKIETRRFFYPLHKQPCFSDLKSKNENYHISEMAYTCGLSLPVFCSLAKEQIEYVCRTIIKFYEK